MKRTLKIIGLVFGVIFLLLGALAAAYFINPEGFENRIYETFYPKVVHEDKFTETIRVEIPEVYELMWVACSLTEAFTVDENLTSRNERFAAYHTAVEEHFGAYRDHPLIQ